MMNTNFNVAASPDPLRNHQNWSCVPNYRTCHGDNQNSSSDEDSSTDSESDEDVVQMKGGERKQTEDILSVDEEKDSSEEEYYRFLAVSEKHKKDRDGVGGGGSLMKKFDFRTDTITDAVLEEGLALIDTDHEKTKREMEKLYGSKAMKVHSAETKVCYSTASSLHFILCCSGAANV